MDIIILVLKIRKSVLVNHRDMNVKDASGDVLEGNNTLLDTKGSVILVISGRKHS